MDERQRKELVRVINGLDAKISAVAAYVAAMPGASEVDVQRVRQLLGSHQWTPNANGAPGSEDMARTVIDAIRNAASS